MKCYQALNRICFLEDACKIINLTKSLKKKFDTENKNIGWNKTPILRVKQ